MWNQIHDCFLWVNQCRRFERQAHGWEFNFVTDVTNLIGSYGGSWEIDRTWSPYFNLGVATSSIKYCSMNKPRLAPCVHFIHFQLLYFTVSAHP